MDTVNLNLKSSDYAKYLISSDVEFYLSFDQTPPINETTANVVENIGSASVTLVQGSHGLAGKFSPNTKISVPLNFVNRKQFTLSFWLTSANIKPQINKINNSKSFYRVSLFDKGLFSLDTQTNIVSFTNGSFVVFEECKDDNRNSLFVLLFGSNGVITILESSNYATNIPHHFWLTYNGVTQTFELYIDGVKDVLTTILGTEIPSELFSDPAIPFNINNSAIGSKNLLRNNSCILDDLFFINKFISDDLLRSKVINHGAKYAVSDSYKYVDNLHNLMLFDDPATNGISAITNNGRYIYAAKSDGTIYRGEHVFWQTKIDFSIRQEASRVGNQIKRYSSDSLVEYTGESLSIFKSDLRL